MNLRHFGRPLQPFCDMEMWRPRLTRQGPQSGSCGEEVWNPGHKPTMGMVNISATKIDKYDFGDGYHWVYHSAFAFQELEEEKNPSKKPRCLISCKISVVFLVESSVVSTLDKPVKHRSPMTFESKVCPSESVGAGCESGAAAQLSTDRRLAPKSSEIWWARVGSSTTMYQHGIWNNTVHTSYIYIYHGYSLERSWN